MKEKIKNWIIQDYNFIKKYGDEGSARHAIDRNYGVLMFALNSLFNYNSPESKELQNWWDDEMLPKFRELEMGE